MKSFFNQWIRSAGLFFFGVFMIVWGYIANASNNAKVTETQDLVSKEEENKLAGEETGDSTSIEDTVANPATPVSLEKDSVPVAQKSGKGKKDKSSVDKSKKEKAPVVIETEKKAEEASGTN